MLRDLIGDRTKKTAGAEEGQPALAKTDTRQSAANPPTPFLKDGSQFPEHSDYPRTNEGMPDVELLGGISLSSKATSASGEPNGSPVPPSLPKKLPIEVIEGGFVYRENTFNLSGIPLQVLKALVNAKDFRISAKNLQQSIWADSQTGLETVKNAVSDARKALRDAARKLRVKPKKDPIPCVDRGKNLAWRLNLSN